MEAGDVDSIITNPQHPYTQLLIDSIPWPDLNRPWGQQEIRSDDGESAEIGLGCKFAPRCPHVMDRCRTEVPPLYMLEGGKSVASCFLHDGTETLPGEDLGMLFKVG